MQAGLWFVECEERRGTGREQRRDKAQVAQRAVGQLRRLEWTKQPWHREPETEAPLVSRELEPRAWERPLHGLMQQRSIADLLHRHEGGGEIAPIVRERRRAHADLRPADRRIGKGPEVVIEPPPHQQAAQRAEQRKTMRFGELSEERLAVPQIEWKHGPISFRVA